MLLDRAGEVIQKDYRFYDSIRDGQADVYRPNRTWFRYVNRVADEVIRHFADECYRRRPVRAYQTPVTVSYSLNGSFRSAVSSIRPMVPAGGT